MNRLVLNDRLVLFPVGDEAVLYSDASRRLLGLDRSAAYLLLRLADGATVADLTNELGLDSAGAAAAGELADLLEGRETSSEEYRHEIYCPAEVPPSAAPSDSYRLLTTCFTLACPDAALYDDLASGLRHLMISGSEVVDLVAVVMPDGCRWRLCLNGTPQGEALPADMLKQLLYDRLRSIAYQRYPYLMAVHAAVVGDGCRILVLPGLSGSGKSTLAATLLGQGWQLFSDEVALLDRSGDLVPIPLPMCIKEGSWPVVAPYFPRLPDLPVHRRWDRLPVRFPDPGDIVFAASEGVNRRATHLCFPRYQSGSPGNLERLSPVSALRRLTDSGYQVPGLDRECAETIVDWVAGLACFSVTYSIDRRGVATALEGTRDIARLIIPRCRLEGTMTILRTRYISYFLACAIVSLCPATSRAVPLHRTSSR